MGRTKEDILKEIEEHNLKIYNETPANKKLDMSKAKKSWGVDIIPKEFHISLDKKYKTKSGIEVILHEIKMENESGNEVTYPIKGSILKKVGNKTTPVFSIWTLDGRMDIMEKNNKLDLVEV